MKSIFITYLIINIFFSSSALGKNLDAHIHGIINLDMAVDKNELLVMIKSPSESFLGFEYKARTKEDISKVSKVKSDWKNNLFKFLGENSLSDCKVTKSSWNQIFKGENHSSILAESYILCTKSLAGRLLQVSFKKSYTNIREINFQLIREDGSFVNEKKKEEVFNILL